MSIFESPRRVLASGRPEADSASVRIALLFVVYVVLLVWTVLWKLHVPFIGRDDMREIKLIPFASGDGYGASAPFEVIANLLIFVPFGVYLAMLVRSWPAWKLTLVIAAASVSLEIAQFVLASGSSDITDVVVNSAGGVLGIALIAIARRGFPTRAGSVIAIVGAIGTIVIVLAVGMHIASFPRLAPPGTGAVTLQ